MDRSVLCPSEIYRTAASVPYVYRYTSLIPLETNASLHNFAGLFERAFASYYSLYIIPKNGRTTGI
jgi:hypothetical protein